MFQIKRAVLIALVLVIVCAHNFCFSMNQLRDYNPSTESVEGFVILNSEHDPVNKIIDIPDAFSVASEGSFVGGRQPIFGFTERDSVKSFASNATECDLGSSFLALEHASSLEYCESRHVSFSDPKSDKETQTESGIVNRMLSQLKVCFKRSSQVSDMQEPLLDESLPRLIAQPWYTQWASVVLCCSCIRK